MKSAEYDCYAYFTITSLLPLSAIERQMGRPSEMDGWSVGDLRPQGKIKWANPRYNHSRWSMGSELEIGEPVDAHVKALWVRLAELRDCFPLELGMEGVISCTGSFAKHDDLFVFSPGHFATAAYYSLEIDFDFYYDNDFGHEDEGKPYWKWHQDK